MAARTRRVPPHFRPPQDPDDLMRRVRLLSTVPASVTSTRRRVGGEHTALAHA